MIDISFRITVEEVVSQAGWRISRRSSKIELKCCPVCDGGKGRDERTFFINARSGDNYYGAWKCLRAGCQKAGNFWQLIEMAGMDPKEYAIMSNDSNDWKQRRQQQAASVRKMRSWQREKAAGITGMLEREDIRSEERQYKLPTPASSPLKALSAEGRAYLNRRGVSDATIALYKVCSDARGNIAFPALEGTVRQLTKYRLPRDVAKGEKRADGSAVIKVWKDSPMPDGTPVGRPILVGTHLIDADAHPSLYICEGEIKALVAHQAVGHNCVSVPTGASAHDWVEEQWEMLKCFGDIVIAADNDDAGRGMVAELTRRLPDRHAIRVVEMPEGDNDLTDLADAAGLGAVRQVLTEAQPLPPSGIVQMSRFKDPIPKSDIVKGSVASGLGELDRELGNILPGTVTIIGGYTGSGKTRFGQSLAVAAIASKIKVLYASFEDTYTDLRSSVERICAGERYIGEEREHGSGRMLYAAREDIKPFIRQWYDEFFYGLADFHPDVEQLLDLMELAVKRHGCRAICIDNLMALRTPRGTQWDHLAAQAEFARQAADFAKHYQVAVIILCHNNQKSELANLQVKPTIDSFAGSGEIVRWCDNALQLWRYPESHREWARKGVEKGVTDLQAAVDGDAMISIVKARGGARWIEVYLVFEYKSQRFAPVSEADSLQREYGWEQSLPDEKYRGTRRVKVVTPSKVRVEESAPLPAPVAVSASAPVEPEALAESAQPQPAEPDAGDFWDSVAEDETIVPVGAAVFEPIWVGGSGGDGEGIPF